MDHSHPTEDDYQRTISNRRLRRVAKAQRERVAGMAGLAISFIGLITAGLNLPTAIPISLCVIGAVTLALTHHFSQRH